MITETAFPLPVPNRVRGWNRLPAVVIAMAGLSCVIGAIVLTAQMPVVIHADYQVHDFSCRHVGGLNEYLICRAARDERTARVASIEQPRNDR